MSAEMFLEALWAPGWHSLNAKKPRGKFRTVGTYDNPADLAAAAAKLDGQCVWWGVHGMAERPAEGRGGKDDVTAVRALVADLDWKHPARKNPNLPPESVVRDQLASFRPTPTVLVHTGHGLQGYWMLDGPTDVTTGKEVTDRLHDALDAHGLDPERKDLASVLRLPGTTNHKATPVPVRIEYADGPRFTVAELVDALSGVPNETGGEGRRCCNCLLLGQVLHPLARVAKVDPPLPEPAQHAFHLP